MFVPYSMIFCMVMFFILRGIKVILVIYFAMANVKLVSRHKIKK